MLNNMLLNFFSMNNFNICVYIIEGDFSDVYDSLGFLMISKIEFRFFRIVILKCLY